MCKLYAYCRISTQKQDLQRQIDNICKRVKDGMAAKKNKAAAKGITVTYGAKQVVKLITKKSISAKEIILKHSKDFNGTLNDSNCRKLAEISRNTFYKYKSELRAEIKQ